MSVSVTFQFAPAEPGCCVRTCQDVIDLVQGAISATFPETLHGIVIGPNDPGAEFHDSVWIKTTDATNSAFIGILIWSTTNAAWVPFTFDPTTITPGNDCTVLGTANGVVSHRTVSELIDCIPDGAIPCSKVEFGIVPEGCQFQTWNITIQANQDAVDEGRIEFEVTWTSATCGVGRKFVTESPIILGNNYTLDVCMPSDASNITITNLKGIAVGGWSNTTVDCAPDSCATTSGLPIWKNSGELVIPTTAGSPGQVTWPHGLPGKPQFVSARFRCVIADAGYVPGEDIDAFSVIENNGDRFYQMKRDAGNVYFFCSNVAAGNQVVIKVSDGDPNQVFLPASWSLYISAQYNP